MGGAIGLWVAAEWRRQWPALVGVAVLVAIAGGAATALAAGARRADSAYTRFRDATGQPNLAAQVSMGGTKPDSSDEAAERFGAHVEVIDELAALDGVESVEVESWWAISLYPELDPPGVVTAFAAGTFATAGETATPLVVAGRLPGVDDPDAVTINEEAVREMGLEVGDTLTFETVSPSRLLEWATNDAQFASRADLDGPTIEVRVAAVTRSDGDFEQPFPIIDFPTGFARAHGDDIAHVEASIYLRVDPARLDSIAAEVAAILEPYELDVVSEATTSPGAAIVPSIEVGVSTLWIATAVAALGGLLLVATAVGRLVAVSANDHPTLAAIGLTRPSRAMASAAVAIVGIAAGSLAVPPVAWAASGLFPRGAAALAEPDPGLRWDGSTLASGAALTFVAASAVLAVIAAMASGARPVRATSRGPLAGLLRGRPAMSLGASFAADPSGAGRRSRAVAAAAAASVAVAVGAVLVVATFDSSRRHLDESPRLYGAAADMVYESNGTFLLAEVVDQVLATPGVTAVTRQLAINDDSLTATGPGGRAEVAPEAYDTMLGGAVVPVADGRFPQGANEVGLGSETAAALGARVGDNMTIETIEGGQQVTLTVSGIVVSLASTDPEHAFVVHPNTLRALLCPDAPSLDDCNLTVDVYASAGDEAARSALATAGFRDVRPPANVARLGQVGPIPWLLAGFLCLFAAAGLVQAVLTSLRRRRSDLAIAMALGLGPRRAAAALTWQAVFTAVVGSAAGLLLGAIVGPAIWRIIADDVGAIVVTRMPMLIAGAVVIAAVVAAAMLSAWPWQRATRLSPAEALRSE